MTRKKPRVISSTAKAASGGVLAVIALIALMFLQGPGTGSGESDGEGLSPRITTETRPGNGGNASAAPSPAANVEPTENQGLTADERQALSGNVLGILIDDWDYLMEVPGEPLSVYKPAELKQLVSVAKAATGDSNGIRVRILQRATARPKAEEQLRQALGAIGINNDAIYMPGDFIP